MIQQSNNPALHFIGIGGCGMNGVAQLAAHAGYTVSGSDRSPNLPLFQSLKNLGIEIFSQDGSGITEETDFVVYSTAIESDNPDIQKSKSLNIPLLHRAEMLAKLCEGNEVIAIAGTAGKSTVTGLLGHIFEQLGKDPTVYCGAPVLNWKTANKLAGQGCRSLPSLPPDKEAPLSSFESLYPESLCDTRSLRDSTNGREASLLRSNDRREWQPCPTTGNVRSGSGPWIIEADESDKSFLHFHPDHAIITNIAEDHFELKELCELFETFESQVSGITVKSPHPFTVPAQLVGKHNTENINNALTLCKALELDMEKCIEAVSTFRGIERRLERIGDKVIDDFAHSPIKIEAALEAVSGIWPQFNAVWRPHGFKPLEQGLNGFIRAFTSKTAQCVFILPVYYAGGTVEKKITSEQFMEKLKEAGVPAEFVPDYQALETRLLQKDIPVLVMGARDPQLPHFARRIAEKLNQQPSGDFV